MVLAVVVCLYVSSPLFAYLLTVNEQNFLKLFYEGRGLPKEDVIKFRETSTSYTEYKTLLLQRSHFRCISMIPALWLTLLQK